MPIPDTELGEWASMASSVAKEKGEMYFFIGGSEHYVMVYSVATNSWRIGNDSIKHGGSFFTSAVIGGKAFVFGDVNFSIRVQCYDPVLDSLVYMANTASGFASHYDAAVIGKKIYVAEGWMWPIVVTMGGSIYDTELNTWEKMPVGMAKGWTGSAVALGPNLFVLNETYNRKMKVYDHVTDSWMQVKGSGIPKLLKTPYTFAADVENGKIYVVGRKLDVAIATLIEVERTKWVVEWDIVKGPDACSHFFPCNSQIVYA